MKSYGKYISKFLVSFFMVILLLFISNIALFFWMFHHVVATDYGATSPRNMLEEVAEVATNEGIPEDTAEELRQNQIWAMMLSADGKCLWQVNVPEDFPTSYTVQQVTLVCWSLGIRKTASSKLQETTILQVCWRQCRYFWLLSVFLI